MNDRAFHFLSAISFLGCVAIVLAWHRSYRACDVLVGQRGPADRATCTSEFGEIVFEFEGRQQGVVREGWSYFQKSLPRRFRRNDDLAGFAIWRGWAKHYVSLPRSPLWGVAVPYWFVFLAGGILPTVWAARWRRRRLGQSRIAQGLCARCGYDLRASSGRCPECGGDDHVTSGRIESSEKAHG